VTAKLGEGWVDYSEGRHLFVTKGIGAEAQTDHAVKLCKAGHNGRVYVHYHSHLGKCNPDCKFYTFDNYETNGEVAHDWPENEVVEE
jgi:hypothetical protein